MAVVPADVKNIAPEFASLADPEITTAINDAVLEQDAGTWGPMLDRGTKWLAAHILAISHPELSGPGGRTYTYETPTEEKAGPYSRSRFGLEYWRLVRRLGAGIAVTT